MRLSRKIASLSAAKAIGARKQRRKAAGSCGAIQGANTANATKIKDWTVAYWEALHPYSAGGAYVNMMMDEGQERVQASYRDNYARLVEVKQRYDPTNLFHVNQNIKPTM